MQNKKQLNTYITTLKDLKTIIEAYEEIAAMRMRKTKKSVLQNRDFLSGLDDLYRRVMFTYNTYLSSKHGKKKIAKGLRESNGKTLDVLITSNTGLYGEIVKKTYDLFVKNVINNTHDIVIVGKIGRQMYEDFAGKRSYKFFEAPDSGIDHDKIKDIVQFVMPYTNIVVYHGLFVSMLSQQANATFVTGKALESSDTTKASELKCIIEPSVEEVAGFFEKQILASIFEQTMYESSLSKFASRMVSLDVANDNINKSLIRSHYNYLKIKHMSENLNQTERMSGLSLWNKQI